MRSGDQCNLKPAAESLAQQGFFQFVEGDDFLLADGFKALS